MARARATVFFTEGHFISTTLFGILYRQHCSAFQRVQGGFGSLRQQVDGFVLACQSKCSLADKGTKGAESSLLECNDNHSVKKLDLSI